MKGSDSDYEKHASLYKDWQYLDSKTRERAPFYMKFEKKVDRYLANFSVKCPHKTLSITSAIYVDDSHIESLEDKKSIEKIFNTEIECGVLIEKDTKVPYKVFPVYLLGRIH